MNATSLAFRSVEPAPVPVSVRPVSPDDAEQLLQLRDDHLGALPARDAGLLEFHEALFEAPVRAWAWLAHVDDEAVGYAAATVGYSLAERGYCFQLDALHVRAPWPARAIESALFAQVREMAERLGCVQLHWHARDSARRLDARAHSPDGTRCVLALTD